MTYCESQVLRQGLLVEGEILSLNELEKSDWLKNLLQKRMRIPL